MATADSIAASMQQMMIAESPSAPANVLNLQQLEETSQNLLKTAQGIVAQVEKVKAGIRAGTWFSVAEAAVALKTEASGLPSVIESLITQPTQCIHAEISSIGETYPQVQKFLVYFNDPIRSIIQEALRSSDNGNSTWRTITQACYKESLAEDGDLNASRYYDALEETFLESPFDPVLESEAPVLESEAYHEHESRLHVDEEYAQADRCRQERATEQRSAEKTQGHTEWLRFWLNVLCRGPEAPTLYSPLRCPDLADCFDSIPRYLFRAFDPSSSGYSDEIIVTPAKLPPQSIKIDLLALPREEAAEMLREHLNKKCFGSNHHSNLMSWSSSLLFVIQYALWRCYTSYEEDPFSEIKICVVDTSLFPPGQFCRDTSLLREYASAPRNRSLERLLSLRDRFDNGEYLSQGLLYHQGRSHVTSLGALMQSGLLELYPEFDEGNGDKWTRRVEELRLGWSARSTTSQEEIDRALRIAKNAFARFQTLDIAVVLLTLKNRIFAPSAEREVSRAHLNDNVQYVPSEVHRSMEALDICDSNPVSPGKKIRKSTRAMARRLRDLFEGVESVSIESNASLPSRI